MIFALEITTYQDYGWDYEEELFVLPEFQLIENAIRKLDRYEHPFIILKLDNDFPGNEMNIMGGKGKYWIDVLEGSEGELQNHVIFDVEKSTEVVKIWESDQGFETYEFHLLDEISQAIEIAKYYFENKSLHPRFEWVTI